MKAVPYSEIGPIEYGEPIPLVGDAMMRLDRVALVGECVRCKGGLMVTSDYDGSRPAGERTLGWVRCRANPEHHGIRRPRRSPKPYGIGYMKGDQR